MTRDCYLERRRVDEKSTPLEPGIVPRVEEKAKRGKGTRSRRGRGKRQQTSSAELQAKPSLSSPLPASSYQSVLTQGYSTPVSSTVSQPIPLPSTTLRQQAVSFPLSVRSSYPSQSLASHPYRTTSVYPIQNQYIQQRLSRDASVLKRTSGYTERMPSEVSLMENRNTPLMRPNLEGMNSNAYPNASMNSYRLAVPQSMEQSSRRDAYSLQTVNANGVTPFPLDLRAERSQDQSNHPLLRVESVQNGNVFFSSNLSAQV